MHIWISMGIAVSISLYVYINNVECESKIWNVTHQAAVMHTDNNTCY